MASKQYTVERVGQMDFFDNYRVPYNDDASVLVDNTDGVYHGNILEFKLNINNTGKVLFQAIKYLSKMRIKGESVPARILLIDLNATKVYVYNSIDYIDDIQKVYIGAASVGNNAFNSNVTPVAEYDYMDMVDSAEVQKLLINRVPNETDWYVPVDLDENCIVGWAERYYREVPTATKGDFLGDGTGKINTNGEIRDPRHFKGLINPYTEPTNEKFKYLMDCLNDLLNKKDLGAFYTPKAYCEKASELVMKAVERVPDGNDYVIIDRCAGTGNLEAALIGKFDKNGDELISHCVVSTYEYYEYKVLSERIGDKVRNIIPPTEANVIYENGKVSNADAMSKDFIENPLIKQYVNDDKCTIILFENPPYRDDVSDNSQKRSDVKVREPFVQQEFKKVLPTLPNSNISTARDLSNQFIWSGFAYYLRQPTDSYVLFSPIKYWKSLGLACKKFNSGYLFNRAHFHASASALACILWENKDDNNEKIVVPALDIQNGSLVYIKDVILQKCHNGVVVMHHMKMQKNEYIEKSQSVYPTTTPNLQIDEDIRQISPEFYEIYNQCLIAKNEGLNQLYGMGFRKALEKLVTDFVIIQNPNDTNKILKMSLYNRIKTYFEDSNLKTDLMACTRLGNNEAHYKNCNTDEDLRLFEGLIKDTLYYIQREIRHKKAEHINDMKGTK